MYEAMVLFCIHCLTGLLLPWMSTEPVVLQAKTIHFYGYMIKLSLLWHTPLDLYEIIDGWFCPAPMCLMSHIGTGQNHPTTISYFLQLTATEDARRAGDLDTVYMTQWDLAQYFEHSHDTWLSDHFYNRCLETGVQIKGDGRRKEGEAHCHVGLALENRGKGGREGR